MTEYCMVLCTCPDRAVAQRLAERMVSTKLAACVNILPDVTSVYSWKEKIESDQEQLLLIKTHASRYTALESLIVELHPYELPEVIAVPLQHGLPEYLNWISRCTDTR